MKILFVCLGNICRSAMAETMFKQMVSDAGLSDKITVDSAGTSDEEHGHPMHPGARRELKKHGMDGRGHHARQVNRQDFETADFIVGMDDMNMEDLKMMAPKGSHAQIFAIFDLLPDMKGQAIPDPWYTHRFGDTYDSLATALPSWLDKCKEYLKENK